MPLARVNAKANYRGNIKKVRVIQNKSALTEIDKSIENG